MTHYINIEMAVIQLTKLYNYDIIIYFSSWNFFVKEASNEYFFGFTC